MTRFFVYLSAWCARRRKKRNTETFRAEESDGGIGAEAPIRTKSEDRLRRADFASRVAGVLSELSLREGRVFAIRGGWGFGKSSLKYLIIERLQAIDNGADWLDFNPWQWGDGDSIARALFGQMSDSLGGKHSKAALNRAEALRRYGAILTGASKSFKEAGSSGGTVSTVLTNTSVIAIALAIGFDLPDIATVAGIVGGLSVVASQLGRIMLYLGRDRSNEPLDKVRKSLEGHLRELDRPLVVFVDDIDRLEPEQIRMLFRQVKANANLPNIVFVLLFQPNIVERALDQIACGDGRAFLEKIVQTNFDLPVVPVSTVHKMYSVELSRLAERYATEENGFTQKRWAKASIGCIQPFLRNLRDMRRLISSISVHLPLHVADDVFEVNIIDFFLLETIRVFEPSLHEALFREQGLLLRADITSLKDSNAVQETVNELLETVREPIRDVVHALLKELFPVLEVADGGVPYSRASRQRWHDDKRVCVSRYFPRYFELQTAVGEMSERSFIDFLEATRSTEALSQAMVAIEANGLLTSLVMRLSESVNRLPVENAAVLLPEMFEIAEKVMKDKGGVFSLSYQAAWTATNQFLNRVEKSERGALALEALRSTKGLSIGSMLIYLSDPVPSESAGEDISDLTLDTSTVEAMKSLWLELMKDRALNDYSLIDEPNIMTLLYRWRAYAGSIDGPREWVEKAIQVDQGFVKIATSMMSRGERYSARDRVSSPHYSFDKTTVDDYIGIAVAKSRYDSIDPSAFPEHDEVLGTLNSHLKMWLGL